MTCVWQMEESRFECLVKLLVTTGQRLEKTQRSGDLTALLTALKTVAADKRLANRIKFMILDLLDLSKDRYVNLELRIYGSRHLW